MTGAALVSKQREDWAGVSKQASHLGSIKRQNVYLYGFSLCLAPFPNWCSLCFAALTVRSYILKQYAVNNTKAVHYWVRLGSIKNDCLCTYTPSIISPSQSTCSGENVLVYTVWTQNPVQIVGSLVLCMDIQQSRYAVARAAHAVVHVAHAVVRE